MHGTVNLINFECLMVFKWNLLIFCYALIDDAGSLHSHHHTNGNTDVDHPTEQRRPQKMISAASVDEDSVL